jgi:hypothetical protein
MKFGRQKSLRAKYAHITCPVVTLSNMTQMHDSVPKFLFVFRIDILKVYGAVSPKVIKGAFTLARFRGQFHPKFAHLVMKKIYF